TEATTLQTPGRDAYFEGVRARLRTVSGRRVSESRGSGADGERGARHSELVALRTPRHRPEPVQEREVPDEVRASPSSGGVVEAAASPVSVGWGLLEAGRESLLDGASGSSVSPFSSSYFFLRLNRVNFVTP